MNKVSRLFLVFMLTILTVFAVSACTKKENNQDNKTTMTEEPGIPLETYLNGNFKNVPFYIDNMKKITLKPSKHPKRTTTVGSAVTLYFNQTNTKQVGNLKLYKYKNFEDMVQKQWYDHNKRKLKLWFRSAAGVWSGLDMEYSVSYYKDGKNIYTKNYQEKLPPHKDNEDYYISTLTNLKDPGTYIFHIHHTTHVVGYWDAEERITYLKDHVFAFQIGDGEDVG